MSPWPDFESTRMSEATKTERTVETPYIQYYNTDHLAIVHIKCSHQYYLQQAHLIASLWRNRELSGGTLRDYIQTNPVKSCLQLGSKSYTESQF